MYALLSEAEPSHQACLNRVATVWKKPLLVPCSSTTTLPAFSTLAARAPVMVVVRYTAGAASGAGSPSLSSQLLKPQ